MDRLRDVGRYTATITSPSDMLDKLWFNIQVFEWALSARDGGTNQAYAVLDYAQASCAMHAWVCEALRPTGVSEALIDRVPWARAFRDIANSSKHAGVRERYWPGGSHSVTFRAEDGARNALDENLSNPDNFSGFLRSIVEGQAWGEGLLVDEQHPDGVLARDALIANHSGWTEVMQHFGLN